MSLLLAMLIALSGCSQRTGPAPQPEARAASPADVGARLYDTNCAACHQQDGSGIPGVYPTMIGSPLVLGDPKQLVRWVLKGQRPAGTPTGGYPTKMASFDWMKPKAAAQLLSYLRSSFGNAAPAIDEMTVEKALESSQ